MDDDFVFLLPEVVDRAVTTPSVKATHVVILRIINMKRFTFTSSLWQYSSNMLWKTTYAAQSADFGSHESIKQTADALWVRCPSNSTYASTLTTLASPPGNTSSIHYRPWQPLLQLHAIHLQCKASVQILPPSHQSKHHSDDTLCILSLQMHQNQAHQYWKNHSCSKRLCTLSLWVKVWSTANNASRWSVYLSGKDTRTLEACTAACLQQ